MFEFATCSYCGHICSRDYINGRYRWHCDKCNKNVKPKWTDKPTYKTPMETEPYEPLNGSIVEININRFQERLNANTF